MIIGKIISVEYDRFCVKLFHTTKNSTLSINGHIYYFGNIGSYLKTINSLSEEILCEVNAVLDHNIENKFYSDYNLDSSREIIIKPIGTIHKDGKFSLGIGVFPSIYSDVSIVTIDDISKVLNTTNLPEIETTIHTSIEIGYSKNMIDYRINLDINKLFNIHTAVLGNSGSGKSNTVAVILQQIYRKKNNCAAGAKTILFDVNGEYPKAFSGENNLNTNITALFYKPNYSDNKYRAFYLPYYLMNLEEWLAFLLASDRTQKPFWDRVLQECFKFYKIFEKGLDIETNSIYINYFKWKIRNILNSVNTQTVSDTIRITAARAVIVKCKNLVAELSESSELQLFLEEADNNCNISYGDNNHALSSFVSSIQLDEDAALKIDELRLKPGEYFDFRFLRTAVQMVLAEEEAKGNVRIREFTSTMISRLDYFLDNPDCNFMRDIPKENKFNTETYLDKYLGLSEDKKSNQLITIDSSEVSSDILELLTSVLSRMIFDYRKKKMGEARRKNPVHLILDEAHRYIKKDTAYILKENIFEKIAREGRKYSLYLLISSQRPSELSSTVLSQCGNYIIHRIQNELDMKYIYSVLPYYSEDYVTKIKQAIPGEALIFGNCVPMPIQVKIDRANPDPDSDNCVINKEWFDNKLSNF